MSSTCLGEMSDFPRVSLAIRSLSEERVIDFIVDTGFDGELALPSSFVGFLGNASSSRAVVFADGREENRGIVECMVRLFDSYQPATAMYIDGIYPLLGLGVLEDSLITIEVTNGGEVRIEPIP